MPEQRKQLYVKRSFQQSMILEALLTTFIIMNLIVIIGYFMIDTITDIHDLKQNLAFTVAAIEIIGFIWMYRYNLKASHRIAGPIYHMEQGLDNLATGNLSIAIRLRKNDNFQEVGEQMNHTIANLREKIAEAQHLARLLQESNNSDSEIVDQLVKELSFFQTEPNLSSTDEGKSPDKDAE